MMATGQGDGQADCQNLSRGLITTQLALQMDRNLFSPASELDTARRAFDAPVHPVRLGKGFFVLVVGLLPRGSQVRPSVCQHAPAGGQQSLRRPF